MNKAKGLDQILEEQIELAKHEYKRLNSKLFMSSFAAGLEVGFSLLLIVTLYTLFQGTVAPETLKLITALAYPVGFIFVVIGRSELFTEHTSLAILPVLNKNLSVLDLLKLWGIILLGNLLGGFLFSFGLIYFAHHFSAVSTESIVFVGQHILHFSFAEIVFSGVIAGWLMGLLTWLVTSAQETISRIVIVFLITFFIGIVGLHHSIVGSIEVFSAFLLSDSIHFLDYLSFEFAAVLGNLLGGVIFVGLMKFSQKRSV